MVARTRFDAAPCPVARTVNAIGDWWSLLIVRDAFDGSRRFGEFQRGLGIAKNILAARLRALEKAGVLHAEPAPDGGSHREYLLTDKGRALFPVIVALRQWGEEQCFTTGEDHSRLLDRRTGRPLRPLRIQTADGRPVEPEDTVVEKVPEKEGGKGG
ncbi:winged helix-turn-helix transcriptional regulator [Streptomyces iranensis]|uniref:DNA-binding HxlR family transcriptional regulator n=1 Tax=Streptomyces iranensis TaxID=576784 RepID=A0A060ZJX2_9ACTN|nr:helix-turn-helix domain-containing protein [Streptomyces iranensis]MBP2063400.1 DNA-binding HxlR family transcriptional regulator [Streptomyces iranensis]CDR01571.1 transcriptional regulator, HxlR family [Streptomyces iranensis]